MPPVGGEVVGPQRPVDAPRVPVPRRAPLGEDLSLEVGLHEGHEAVEGLFLHVHRAQGRVGVGLVLEGPEAGEDVVDLTLDHVDDGVVAEAGARAEQDEHVGEVWKGGEDVMSRSVFARAQFNRNVLHEVLFNKTL